MPRISKWPFLAGSAALLGVGWWIVSRSPDPFAVESMILVVACVVIGTWVAIIPFLTQFRLTAKLAESESLDNVGQKLRELEIISSQIANATGQWQDVNDNATKAAAAARQITERMTHEAQAFATFLEKTNDSTKARLKLEVEKLKADETTWLQMVVTLMDHVHALHLGAQRSGKPKVMLQIERFQQACHQTIRRLGIIPVEIEPGSLFDDKEHLLEDPSQPRPDPPRIQEVLAAGFMYQGNLVRRPMVRLAKATTEDSKQRLEEAAAADHNSPDPAVSHKP